MGSSDTEELGDVSNGEEVEEKEEKKEKPFLVVGNYDKDKQRQTQNSAENAPSPFLSESEVNQYQVLEEMEENEQLTQNEVNENTDNNSNNKSSNTPTTRKGKKKAKNKNEVDPPLARISKL